MNFITFNNFTNASSDLTMKFQIDLRSNLNECQSIMRKDERWKYINLNSTAPTHKGLIKIHIEYSLVRPTVNWKNASVSKLAKKLYKQLMPRNRLPRVMKH